MGEGNRFHKELIEPVQLKLLDNIFDNVFIKMPPVLICRMMIS